MPRKTLKQRQERNPTDDNDNRVRSVIDGVIGNEDPDDLMLEILNVLQESGRVPRAGRYLSFLKKLISVRCSTRSPFRAILYSPNYLFRFVNDFLLNEIS